VAVRAALNLKKRVFSGVFRWSRSRGLRHRHCSSERRQACWDERRGREFNQL